MDLLHILKLGYAIVIGTFILMIWVSLSGSSEIHASSFLPCHFNPLCSCYKAVTELGIVQCINIPLPRIPEIINSSKVIALYMKNNGLDVLEPHFLQSTGLYKLAISQNGLVHVPDEAFVGLERTLLELDLSHNRLNRIPTKALKYLRKLKLLDLTGNEVSFILPEHFKGLETSMEKLILSENCIAHLPSDAFTGLPRLDTIDLTGNHLREIDPTVFRDGMDRLANLILADNQLSYVPYQALSPLKALRNLDLSYNIIKNVLPSEFIATELLNVKMDLDLLRLDYNRITTLLSGSFQNFDVANKTVLDGNPLISIQDSAFQTAKIKQLYIRNCGLTEITPESFNGLEGFLEVLDMSGNNLTVLPAELFQGLENLNTLSLEDNPISDLNPKDIFNGFQFSLHQLDLTGITDSLDIQELRRLRSLRELSLSALTKTQLSTDNFVEFGTDLEKLYITNAKLKSVQNHAFQMIHGLKEIDLSDNGIETIEKDAFVDVHALTLLKLAHAFSSSVNILPVDALKPLRNLELLDLSNNRLQNVPHTSFYFLSKLKWLFLQDNTIEDINKGTFQGDIHTSLDTIYLSFNNIKKIQQHTFVDLESLQQLHLDDNKIERIEKRSFMNLRSLKRLNLKGNKISNAGEEAFQNLPELEDLDMSYNSLSRFDFSIFDQVGTLSMFRLNVSHNKISDLQLTKDDNFNLDSAPTSLYSSVKTLDLSHNNVSLISPHFFVPVELSLINLYLSHNELLQATSDIFGNLVYLQHLDISHNRLFKIEENTFHNSRNLQIFSCAYNDLGDVPSLLFRNLQNLRTVDLSHNRLKLLPDSIFKEEGLENLDVSHNSLTRVPLTSTSVAAASTLCKLDLSWNGITAVTNGDLLSRFKSLRWLDLSHNRLVEIDTAAFAPLPRLSYLSLAHNSELILGSEGAVFKGIEDSLLFLHLNNISLREVPHLPLPNLISLSLTFNSLPTVPLEISASLSSIRDLDFGYNDLTIVPITIQSMTELKSLSLAGNPIKVLSNTSFAGVAENLEEIDLANLNLNTFESGTLSKMHFLRTLRISNYIKVQNFNIPRILESNEGLRILEIHAVGDTNLAKEMIGNFPEKLRNITFTGKTLKSLNYNVLQGVRSSTLHLQFRNTSVNKITHELLHNMGEARNLTIDVRDNRELQHLHNPSSGNRPGLPDKTFLLNVLMSGNKWSCDCDLGWVEVWQRKRRQYLCGRSPSILNEHHQHEYMCRHPDDDLRNSFCQNKANQSLIEVLKTDIECGWNSACPKRSSVIFIAFVCFISLKILIEQV